MNPIDPIRICPCGEPLGFTFLGDTGQPITCYHFPKTNHESILPCPESIKMTDKQLQGWLDEMLFSLIKERESVSSEPH